ncbi:hypothetical protein FXO38_07960 [Capsicum annuum]|nr:hypothetical protein FXO38_07960 [Capsicum annuum]KAF3670802.1 hypothetical protein FXO37_08360 [Capsicum annuum]
MGFNEKSASSLNEMPIFSFCYTVLLRESASLVVLGMEIEDKDDQKMYIRLGPSNSKPEWASLDGLGQPILTALRIRNNSKTDRIWAHTPVRDADLAGISGFWLARGGAWRAASMMLLSLSFTWKVLAPYSGTLAVLGTVLYVLSFSLGAGPVPALLLPEIFASRIRAKAVALSLGMHWIMNFFIGLYFLSVVTKFGISTVYLGFASVCLLAVMYIAGNVVETKGRSLEDIERELSPAV